MFALRMRFFSVTEFFHSKLTSVQGHPRSLILVPIKNAYATFLLVISSNYGRISFCLRDIGKTTEFPIEQDVVDEFLNPAIVTITEAIGSPEKRRLSITCVG